MNLTMLNITLQDKRSMLQEAEARYMEAVAGNHKDDMTVSLRSQLAKEVEVLRDDVKVLEERYAEGLAAAEPKKAEAVVGNEIEARANYFRSLAGIEKLKENSKRFLGAIDGGATQGNGKNLLPVNIQTSLITDPETANPFRGLATYTMINGLQLPTISNTDFLAAKALLKDGETGHEIQLNAGMIQFVPARFSVFTKVSNKMLRSTDTALEAFIRAELGRELANKERLSALGTAEVGKEHMNLYHAGNALPVTEVTYATAEDLYNAILEAYYGLHQDYMVNAKVLMSQTDYVKVRKFLANTSETLFSEGRRVIESMEVVFDVEAKFESKGIIVGDFRKYHINYETDSGSIKAQEDITTGLWTIALEAYFDARIITPLAFKILKKKVV